MTGSFFQAIYVQKIGEVGKGAEHLDLTEVDAIEAVEQQLDAFIEKRTREAKEQQRVEAEWALSERRHRERRQERNRQLWRAYHLERAECLEQTAAELAASHRARASALAEGEGHKL